jgi:hypothetical protein
MPESNDSSDGPSVGSRVRRITGDTAEGGIRIAQLA